MTKRNYKNWKVKDFKKFYEENCKGMSRGEVAKKDQALYLSIWKRGLLDKIIKIRKRKEKIFLRNFSLGDFQKYYHENYKGKSRSEVCKETPGFYNKVRINDFLDKVFPKGSFTKFSLEELQNHYNENHEGKSRTEMIKEAPGFYNAVRINDFLDKVFPKDKRGKVKDWKKFELKDFQKYYHENYKGKSRNEVRNKDNSFYNIVRYRSFLDKVFPGKRSGRPRKSLESTVKKE